MSEADARTTLGMVGAILPAVIANVSGETDLYSVLIASSDVTAHVGARIYPLVLPQNPTYPALTYELIEPRTIMTLSGPISLSNPQIELNVWARTYKEAKELAGHCNSAVVAAPTSVFVGNLADTKDLAETVEEMEIVYRVQQTYSVWHTST